MSCPTIPALGSAFPQRWDRIQDRATLRDTTAQFSCNQSAPAVSLINPVAGLEMTISEWQVDLDGCLVPGITNGGSTIGTAILDDLDGDHGLLLLAPQLQDFANWIVHREYFGPALFVTFEGVAVTVTPAMIRETRLDHLVDGLRLRLHMVMTGKQRRFDLNPPDSLDRLAVFVREQLGDADIAPVTRWRIASTFR